MPVICVEQDATHMGSFKPGLWSYIIISGKDRSTVHALRAMVIIATYLKSNKMAGEYTEPYIFYNKIPTVQESILFDAQHY